MIRRRTHNSVQEASEDIQNLESSKEEQITWATRAPTSADKGRIWVKYTEASDTTITIYLRHPRTGTWRGEDLT